MAPARIPKVKGRHWMMFSWVPLLMVSLGTIITGVISIMQLAKNENVPTSAIGWAIAALSFASIAAIWLAIIGFHDARKKNESNSPNDLKGCVRVLWRILRLLDKEPLENVDCLRITIHRFDDNKKTKKPRQLEQVIDYVGGRGDGRGRKFPLSIGIMGKALREFEHDPKRSIALSKRKSSDRGTFVAEMIKEWGYSDSSARKLTQDRCSWMTVVLADENRKPMGCVYLDSDNPEYFDDNLTQEIIIRGALAIALYIRERYT